MNEKFASIALAGSNADDLSILKEYADFWKVPYTVGSPVEEKQVLFTSDPETAIDVRNSSPLVVSPTRIEGATQIARHFGLKVAIEEALVRMPISPGVSVSLLSELYRFSGPNLESVLEDGENVLVNKIHCSNVHILSLDLISEYNRLMYRRMDENPSWRFQIGR